MRSPKLGGPVFCFYVWRLTRVAALCAALCGAAHSGGICGGGSGVCNSDKDFDPSESWQNRGHRAFERDTWSLNTKIAKGLTKTMGFCNALWLPLAAAALIITAVNASLTQSRLQNRHLQRVMNHHRITIVLEGVRARALNSIKPDPILLINFPEIDHQFKVSVLKNNLYCL